MRRFLAFGVSAAISVLATHAGAENVKPRPAKPAPDASRGASQLPSKAETPDEAEARRLRDEDERKATESKEKMKKRPGYKDEVPLPRA